MQQISIEELSQIIMYARLSGILQEKFINEKNKISKKKYKQELIYFGNLIFDILQKNNFDIEKVLEQFNKFEWEKNDLFEEKLRN